jgi:hypothetical protein
MTLEQLTQLKKDMSLEERQARYQDCLNSGGCEAFMQPIAGDVEYCGNCLTFFVNEVPQDLPSPATPDS